MPRIAAEERRLAGIDPLGLTGRGIRQDHRSAEDMQHLVSREDRAEGVGVPERRTDGQPEHDLVDQRAGYVDPVEHLTGLRVAPYVPRHLSPSQRGGAVERGARGRTVCVHGRGLADGWVVAHRCGLASALTDALNRYRSPRNMPSEISIGLPCWSEVTALTCSKHVPSGTCSSSAARVSAGRGATPGSPPARELVSSRKTLNS